MTFAHSPVFRPALIGLAASYVVMVSSAMRGWPFPNLTAEPWLFQLTTSNTITRYAFVLAFYAAVIALCWSWVTLLGVAKQHVMRPSTISVVFVLWTLPLMLTVPLFSGDVYVYYVDGEALARGFSPYESGVSAMGAEPMVHMVHPIWRHTQTMYGPVFMAMAEGVARLSDGSVITGVSMFRLISLVSVGVMGWGISRLCRHFDRPVAEGLTFALLNPLTLLHLVGGAHNDATMLGLLVAGLAVGVSAKSNSQRLLAIALCIVGAAFKAPAFAGVLVLGWIWAGQNVGVWRRLVSSAVCACVGVLMLHVAGVITGLGWGWTKASDVPGMAHPILAPANAFAFALGGPFGVPYGVNSVSRAVAMLAAVVISLWLVLRTGRSARPEVVVRALGWSLLALAWLGPAVYPWYVSWGIVIVGAMGVGTLRRHLVAVTILVNFAVAPGGYGLLDTWNDWRRTIVATIWFAVVAYVAWSAMKLADMPAPRWWPRVIRAAWVEPVERESLHKV